MNATACTNEPNKCLRFLQSLISSTNMYIFENNNLFNNRKYFSFIFSYFSFIMFKTDWFFNVLIVILSWIFSFLIILCGWISAHWKILCNSSLKICVWIFFIQIEHENNVEWTHYYYLLIKYSEKIEQYVDLFILSFK